MSTVTTQITGSTYVGVSTATDAIIQNSGVSDVRLAFELTQPADNYSNYHILGRQQAIQKLADSPAGGAWVRMDTPELTGSVTVSE